MSFSESKIISQITILPASGAINVQWSNQVKKGADVISETYERKAYSADLAGFSTEVGALDVNAFLAAFNVATLDAKADALAAKATAEAALTQANTAHAAAITTLESAHTAVLAAKDATIAQLQAQIDALTPTAPIPTTSVTARQIRLALTQAGLRTQVEAAVAAGDQSLKDWYEYANEFERNNAHVVAMAAGLGVSDDALDDLFALAGTL